MTRQTVAIVALLLSAWISAPVQAATVPLADAAEANDTAHALDLLRQGADPQSAQADGMTALHWACHHDNAKLAIALLDAGAAASPKNRYDTQPLSLACSNGNAAIIDRLLAAGADPNASVRGGETALMTAARTGRLAPVRSLLKAGAALDAKERRGQTALMWAAAEGHLEVARTLLEAGADYTTPLDSGFTPYFFAARQGHGPIVRLFLDAGVSVNATIDRDNKSALLPRRGTSALLLAMENGHFELAVELLERGADPNDMGAGFSPLHSLSWIRKPDRGEGAAGKPPPDVTGPVNSLDFARELVKRGAKIDLRLPEGKKAGRANVSQIGATPFFMAADTADLEYMKLLVELGADPFLPNEDGATPLMVAAGLGSSAPEEEAGSTEECARAVEYLVSLGADVNTVDLNGETAMHGAAYKNAPEVVEVLHRHGADIRIWNTLNEYDRTPLLIAEGYRPGNFKPSFPTVDAITAIMLAQGVALPTGPKPEHVNYAP